MQIKRLAAQDCRTFFLTLVCANRRRVFQVHANAHLMINLFTEDRAKDRYLLHAFVLMPDHLHVLVTPAPLISLEKTIQFLKGGFSFRLKSKLDVWQKGHNEHRIVDAMDYEGHVRYIHENPMRARLAVDYPFTSARLRDAVDPAPAHFQTGAKALLTIAGNGEAEASPSHR